MNEHPLHKKVGEQLLGLKLIGQRPILDEACDNSSNGKKQQISLFVHKKNLESRLCKVDAIIVQQENNNDTVKIIIEIEESGFNPTKICGKYLTSAIANKYIDSNGKTIVIPENSVLFIQIVDLPKLVREKENSKKRKQLEIIRDEINKNKIGCIKQYELIFMDRNNQKDFDKFRDVIEKYLNIKSL